PGELGADLRRDDVRPRAVELRPAPLPAGLRRGWFLSRGRTLPDILVSGPPSGAGCGPADDRLTAGVDARRPAGWGAVGVHGRARRAGGLAVAVPPRRHPGHRTRRGHARVPVRPTAGSELADPGRAGLADGSTGERNAPVAPRLGWPAAG